MNQMECTSIESKSKECKSNCTLRKVMKSTLATVIAASIAISSLAVSASADVEEELQAPAVTEEVTTTSEIEDVVIPEETEAPAEETTVPEETEAPVEETTVPEETEAPVEEETTTSEEEEAGDSDEDLSEELERKDAEVDGDFYYTTSNNNATITGYIGDDTVITVPSTVKGYPVVAIGNDVFNGLTEITKVTLPSSIESIGSGTFYGCERLATVILPSSLKTIGSSAFSGCKRLENITLPNGLETINSSAFYGCKRLGTLAFPATLKTLGDSAFEESAITYVSLPESLTKFGLCVFKNCDSLTTVDFFETSYDDEDTVLEWSIYRTYNPYNDGFAYCDNLTRVELNNEHITKVPQGLFYECPKLKSVTFPSSLKTIGQLSFTNCDSLESITIPAALEVIDYQAFDSCDKLATVNFPSKLLTIGDYAFRETALKSVSIPNTLTTFGIGAFINCDKLTTVNFYDSPYDDEFTELEWNIYRTYDPYNDGFAYCDNLTTVNLGNMVHTTSIPRGLFYECKSLKSVTFPSTLVTISQLTFKNCDSLESITLPANLEKIGYEAFNNCDKLAKVNFPAKLKTIESDAFNSTALKKVNLPETLTYLGVHAFMNCTSLTSVTCYPTDYAEEDTVFGWGIYANYNQYNSAFYGCTSLLTAKISRYAKEVPIGLFENCSSLKGVTIPVGVTEIKTNAFNNCSSLNAVYYTGTQTNWDSVTVSATGNEYFAKASYNYRSMNSPEFTSVTSKGGKVTLTWNGVVGASSYRVYRADSLKGAKTLIGTVTKCTYVDESAAGGNTYYYFVVAYNSTTKGKSDYSGETYAYVPVKPAAPTNVKAVSGGGNATITWNAVNGATSYRVYRSTSATGTKELLKIRTSLYFIDTTAKAGTTYYYWVAAYNTNTSLLSAYSTSSSVKIVNTFDVKPVINNASVASTKVTLTWNVVPGATSYRIYRRNASGNRVLIKTQSMTEFTDTGLTKGQIYKYEVRAYSATTGALSEYSAIKQARPMAAPTIISGNVNCKITWEANLYATSYRVYRSSSATGAKKLLKATGNTYYTDSTAVAGETYYYWVAAYDSVTGSLTGYSAPKIIKKQ